jgi:myo-inositol-1(or 4)-monophosphatase
MSPYHPFLTSLALKAGDIIRANFTLGMEKEWKSDYSPLTVTDTTINAMVIEAVQKEFPEHALLGEEASDMRESDYVWVCDPIDGTLPFSHGYPTFMFSLALTHRGESIAGVMYDPIMDRMFYAEKGKGATLNGKPIHVSTAANFTNQMLNFDSNRMDGRWANLRTGIRDAHGRLTTLWSATYGSSLVACGEFVAEIYSSDKPWDGAAVKVIVEEAGGKVTDLDGNDQRYDKPLNGFIASNGVLHGELVGMIKEGL